MHPTVMLSFKARSGTGIISRQESCVNDLGQNNNFPMKEWHVAHMEKAVVRYVKGLSADASSWEKRQHKKYGNASSICRQIEYDIKHGVEKEQVLSFLERVRIHDSFSDLRKNENSLVKLDEIKEHLVQSRKTLYW